MNTRTYTFSIDKRAKIFWALSAVSILSLLLYIYAVLATVQHTVARENLKSAYADLSAKVSELEFKDISLKNTINLATASNLGLSEVTSPLYVSRQPSSLTLNVGAR